MQNLKDLLPFVTVFALQAAAIYAVAASGLVVTYATSGVFNFAHGAIGMLAAFSYWELWQNRGWPAGLALVVVLFIEAPLLGLVLDVVIMRRLSSASMVTKIVVTIGLLVAFLSLAGIVWPQGETRTLPEFFGGRGIKMLGTQVDYHLFVVVGCALAVALALRVILYQTRLGIAMRAMVDDRELGGLVGVDANRVSSLSWMLGSVLAALAGVLIAPILPTFSAVTLTLLVISAYAAAMVGRLRSLPLTILGAFVLAEFEQILGWIDSYKVGGEKIGELAHNVGASAPILLLFLVLVFLPEDRATFGVKRRTFTPKPSLRAMGIGMVVYIAVAAFVAESGWVSDTTLIELGKGIALGIVMLSLVLLTGYAGQVSLAQLGFAGIGAVVVWKLGPVAGLLGAAVVAAAIGALVALPALKMRDLYLALSTMAFALLLEQLVYGNTSLFTDQLGSFAVGSATAKRIPGLTGDTAFFIAMAVAFAAVAMLLTVIRNGAYGRRLAAMKDSPAACATLGLDLTVTKLQTFALAAGIAGVGGALLAMWKTSGVGTSDFALVDGPLNGLALVLIAVVGGISSVGGAVFGSVGFVMMPVIGGWWEFMKNPMRLLPGVAGIGLGQNPDGVAGQVAGAAREYGEASTSTDPTTVPAVPEKIVSYGPVTPEEIAVLDDVLGLSWGRGGA